MVYQVLYNPLAGNGKCMRDVRHMLRQYPNDSFVLHDLTQISDLNGFISLLRQNEQLLICGGDGTLHCFINGLDLSSVLEILPVYYYPAGTGDDFYRDITSGDSKKIVNITKYLKDLPTVTLQGRTFSFLNNVSFGIDGYVCEAGDRIRNRSTIPVSYLLLAVRGLIGGYKPRGATVTVDGKTSRYEHVWLAPSMNGRFIGNGMPAAPMQNRMNSRHTVTSLVFDCPSRMKTLVCFPRLLNATHVSLSGIHIVQGNSITVVFDAPCSVQVDGEVFLNITSYSVETAPNRLEEAAKEGD